MLERKNLPFEKALCTVKINRMAEGTITTRRNQVIETNINIVNSKARSNIIAERHFSMEGGSIQQQLEIGTTGINGFDTSIS